MRKIFSVSSAVSLRSLRDGTRRSLQFRGRSFRIPLRVFENLCKSAGLHVEDGVVSSPRSFDLNVELSHIEQVMCQILKESGQAVTRKEFRARCIGYGVNPTTFGTYLSYSPIFPSKILAWTAVNSHEPYDR